MGISAMNLALVRRIYGGLPPICVKPSCKSTLQQIVNSATRYLNAFEVGLHNTGTISQFAIVSCVLCGKIERECFNSAYPWDRLCDWRSV